MNAVCTIVAKNYYASARVLGESLLASNPEMAFHILLADDVEEAVPFDSGPFSFIEADQIGIPNFRQLAFKYDVTEFCTAVKPFLLEYLFSEFKYEKVVYLDPDIYVFEPLTDVLRALDEADIVLTPHIVEPPMNSTEGPLGFPVEVGLLGSGVFNLGFAAFRQSVESNRILKWWKARLSDFCFADRNTNLFTDQKWMDLLPCISDRVKILKDKRFNVAWWNFNERNFRREAGKWEVETSGTFRPIVFFHFSGYKPDIVRRLSRFPVEPADKEDLLQEIHAFYRERLMFNGYVTYSQCLYTYNAFANGYIVTMLQRRLLRALLSEGHQFEDPFEVGPGSFYHRLLKKALVVKKKYTGVRIDSLPADEKPKLIAQVNGILSLFRHLLGPTNFSLMVRFFNNRVTLEAQSFLLKAK